jgi:hypothetical protein
MSTEGRARARSERTRRRRRGFFVAFGAVAAILVVAGAAGAAASVLQGPRVTQVRSDPDAAVAASGSRVIFTANQSLAEVDTDQVTIEPAAPFTVDTSGRSVGVRFTVPLHDDTRYSVRIDGVHGLSGQVESTFSTALQTPVLHAYLLHRGGDDSTQDEIVETDLSGDAQPVFRHPHIEDFRAAPNGLVVSVQGDDGFAQLVWVPEDGSQPRELALPGDGTFSNLQVSERGDLVGYTWSDASLASGDGGRESELFLTDLNDPEALPQPLPLGDADPSIDDYRFVPDSPAILLLNFAGELLLVDPEGSPAPLGTALWIDDVARGEPLAWVERNDGPVVIDLRDASESASTATPDPELGTARSISAVPGGGAVAVYVHTTGGLPDAQAVVRVGDDGPEEVLADVPMGDGILEVCVAPSGRYAAVLVAPDLVANPYDLYTLPLPGDVETRVIDISDGSDVATLDGFDISWCRVPPR